MASLLGKSTRRPDIVFYPSGRIAITARISRMLTLQPGDVIDIQTDRDECNIFVRYRNPVGRHVARCHPSAGRRNSAHYICYSRPMVKAMAAIAGMDPKRAMRFPCGYPFDQEGTVYIPIITKLPIQQ